MYGFNKDVSLGLEFSLLNFFLLFIYKISVLNGKNNQIFPLSLINIGEMHQSADILFFQFNPNCIDILFYDDE